MIFGKLEDLEEIKEFFKLTIIRVIPDKSFLEEYLSI